MKRLLLFTAMVVFGITTIHAQEFHFGIKAGINFASVYGDTEGIDPITSIGNFGVVGELGLTDKFSFQPEFMYSIQGFSFDTDGDVVELHYLNLPLMGKYYLSKRLSLEAGPQIGLLVSAKDESDDVKNQYKSTDFGFNAGLGYKLDNGINFGFRYNFGISNINDMDGSSAKIRNGVATFSVGYFFF